MSHLGFDPSNNPGENQEVESLRRALHDAISQLEGARKDNAFLQEQHDRAITERDKLEIRNVELHTR